MVSYSFLPVVVSVCGSQFPTSSLFVDVSGIVFGRLSVFLLGRNEMSVFYTGLKTRSFIPVVFVWILDLI